MVRNAGGDLNFIKRQAEMLNQSSILNMDIDKERRIHGEHYHGVQTSITKVCFTLIFSVWLRID